MADSENNPLPLPIVVVTRFAYLGSSGWKVSPEDQAKVLFDPERLSNRLDLFRNITVASLQSQTDRDFHHYILTSQGLPDWARQELEQICISAYGEGGYTIDARRPGLARKFLMIYLQKRFGEAPVAQVVLDDDDGLASDFMTELKDQISGYFDQAEPKLPHFFSWPKGYGCVFDGAERPRLYLHRYRFINLGLTIVATPQQKNILAIDHRKAPPRFGATLDGDKTMFIRSIHQHNDSRVAVTKRWIEFPDWPTDHDVATRFTYILALDDHS